MQREEPSAPYPYAAQSQEAFIASEGEREDLVHKVATLGQLTHLAYDCPKKHSAADVLGAARRIVKEAGLNFDFDLGRRRCACPFFFVTRPSMPDARPDAVYAFAPETKTGIEMKHGYSK